MEEPVAYNGLVYVARLRVGDVEGVIGTVYVRLRGKVTMKRKNIVHQSILKLLHILLLALAAHEFLPCLEQILD